MGRMKVKNKDYIIDDIHGKEKIRNCYLNIAKMNPFEFIYYEFKYWGYGKKFLRIFRDFFCEFLEFLQDCIEMIINILFLITFPISFPISAYFRIRKAKKAIENEKRIYG